MKKIILTLLMALFVSTPVLAETIVFNPKTHKMHTSTCPSAVRCKTCIKIDKAAAVKRGAVPCKKCMK